MGLAQAETETEASTARARPAARSAKAEAGAANGSIRSPEASETCSSDNRKEEQLTDNTDIAVPAGVDREGRRLFRKGDSLLTEDELQADAEKLYARQVEDIELDQ